MFTFEKISEINGLDANNPKNAKQNSYAWSMAELDDYIYIGTSRNLANSVILNYASDASVPQSLITGTDNCAEIWRYNKNGSHNWHRVFKADTADKAFGFRIMITHKACGSSPAIYAVSTGKILNIFKSYDGTHWKKLKISNIVGNSSRAMASLNGKLYLATINESSKEKETYLYVSSDPEKEPFKLITDKNNKNYISSLNPQGEINTLTVFNNKLYAGGTTSEGAAIWRSNTSDVKMNDWTLVADKGFGDNTNMKIMSTGIYKDYLYAAVTKPLPLALLVPMGFDLIRINKNDEWHLVAGSKALVPTNPATGRRNSSLSGFNSGFNSPFNVYGWQITEFKNNLIITTFDSSINISVIIAILIYNKDVYIKKLGYKKYSKLVKLYMEINHLLCKYDYPKGFDIYVSEDGCHFNPVKLKGFENCKNYGGRTMHVSYENELYIGTANPFEGCQVWKGNFHSNDCLNTAHINTHEYFHDLDNLNRKLLKLYPHILKIIPDLITI